MLNNPGYFRGFGADVRIAARVIELAKALPLGFKIKRLSHFERNRRQLIRQHLAVIVDDPNRRDALPLPSRRGNAGSLPRARGGNRPEETTGQHEQRSTSNNSPPSDPSHRP